MLLFLMVASTSLFGLAVCCIAFAGQSPEGGQDAETRPDLRLSLGSSRFFAGDTARPEEGPAVAVPSMLESIELHIRLERAAAESFIDGPTPDLLHSSSHTPLVN